MKKLSEKHIENIRKSLIGRPRLDLLGKSLSKEHKEKIRISCTGKKYPTLLGNKNALGNKAFTGKKHSQATINKIKETKKNNPFK
jgi:hypothetical protein